jgi:hypothetical protein
VEAELYRLQGDLLLAAEGHRQPATGNRVREAKTSFQQALAIARQQHAKSLELRTAVSLGRLWQAEGKRNAARKLWRRSMAGSPGV